MQTLVLVALFRQQTREKIIAWIEWVLPDRIPGLWGYLGLTATPAELLHDYIRRRIAEFQAGVSKRAAAQALDTRCADFCLDLFAPPPLPFWGP